MRCRLYWLEKILLNKDGVADAGTDAEAQRQRTEMRT